VDEKSLARWCEQRLGATHVEVLFTSGHLAVVVGVRLADDREVVVKIRPAASRVGGCVEVQQHLWACGFPCPKPLAGPAPIGAHEMATAEEYVPGGIQLPRDRRAPEQFAGLLWQLIDLCEPLHMEDRLNPPPSWMAWDHAEDGVWPRLDEGHDNLNADAEPRWLDDVAERARSILLRFQAPAVVGHADWESQNIRWRDGRPLVVHDWDSAASRPEATLAGAASAVFTRSGEPGEATIAETELFLDAYQAARGTEFTIPELGAAWAAGLWVRAVDAKEVRVHRRDETEAFADEAWERLRRADQSR
jgi:hypothetical protein